MDPKDLPAIPAPLTVTREVAQISEELALELHMIPCEDCGRYFAPEQIQYTDRQKLFHPKCPVHWEEYCERHAGEWAQEIDDYRREQAGKAWWQKW